MRLAWSNFNLRKKYQTSSLQASVANENSLSNNLYRCDIALRRIVAEEVTNISRGFMDQKLGTKANVQTLGRELSEAKAILLKRLKQSTSSQMPTVDELKTMLFDVYQQLRLDRLSDNLHLQFRWDAPKLMDHLHGKSASTCSVVWLLTRLRH
ncbi:hypothetical protein D918_05432, partial [Trichuris suis]